MNWALVVGNIVAFVMLYLVGSLGQAHIAGTFKRLVGVNRLSFWLYRFVLLPGTFVHETGHTLAALTTGVRVEKFSLWPSAEAGDATMGYIKHGKANIVQRSLIGLGPLLLGTLALLLIGLLAFDMDTAQAHVAAGDWPRALATLVSGFGSWPGWLAAYLVFAVSATMFPSPTDRMGWIPVVLFLLALVLVSLPVGFAPTILSWLAGPVNTALRWLFLIVVFTLIVDFFGVLLLIFIHQAVSKRFPQP